MNEHKWPVRWTWKCPLCHKMSYMKIKHSSAARNGRQHISEQHGEKGEPIMIRHEVEKNDDKEKRKEHINKGR